MNIGNLRLVFLLLFCMVFLASSFSRSFAFRSPVQQILLDLPPDPEGQSVPTVTLTKWRSVGHSLGRLHA